MRANNYKDKVATLLEVKKYIDECLDDLANEEPVSINGKDIAAHFGHPYMTFRQFVQEVGGFTLHNYIRLRKVQKAAELMRKGASTTKAAQLVGYETLAGFNKAFLDIYGVTSSVYADSRGRCRMTEPELEDVQEFFIVGYLLTAGDRPKEEERGGWWIGKTFPNVSAEEWMKIGGGDESTAIWVEWEDRWFYILGPPVQRVHHVPKYMRSHRVPGGQFAVFRAPPSKNNTELCDNMRALWWYAFHQWLPESEFDPDESRIPFEFYLNDDNRLYVPVKRRGPPNEGLEYAPEEN